jgi:HD-GYP domain-containing protein (c-di-GMP phosphodiesterase class II)
MSQRKKTSPIQAQNKKLDHLNKEIKDLSNKYEDLKRRYQEKSRQVSLFRAVEFINSEHFELQQFLNRMIDWVMNATKTESAALLMLDESGENLEFMVAKGPSSKNLKGQSISKTEGIAGQCFSSNKPYISQNVKDDPTWSSRIAQTLAYSTMNLLAVPLCIRGEAKGVIEIINKKDGELFYDEDVSLLESLSTELALALENARLLESARYRAENFSKLARLSAILNSSLDPKTVRKRALESVVELLECETGSLYLIDEETNELYFEVALGDKGAAVKKVRLKMGEGVAGWVAQKGQSDLVADTNLDQRWAKRVDEKSDFITTNMITVPIKTKNKVIGVLQAINKLKNKKPDQSDLKLLESLSDQVAIALENARLYEKQKEMFFETAEAMATAIEKRDPYTGGHTRRVRDFSLATGKHLGLDEESLELLEITAILHDIGKIGVDDSILRKPGKLSDEEFEKMKMHPSYGYEILNNVKQLAPAIPGMRHHHERIDGRGYPNGLKGKEIPLLARIICVADTWDAMTSNRPYRDGLSDKIAYEEFKQNKNKQFDLKVVNAFLRAYNNGEIVSQKKEEKDK